MFIAYFQNAPLLITLLISYNAVVAERYGKVTAPIDFLTGEDGIDALPTLVENRKKLIRKLEEYERLMHKEDAEAFTLLQYAIETAYDKVNRDFLKYKEMMLSKGAEQVFEDAYYINIAANIVYFFEVLENSCSICEEDMARILEYSLLDGFFENIMSYASDVDSFDVSDLGRTTEEIRSFVYLVSPSMWSRHDEK